MPRKLKAEIVHSPKTKHYRFRFLAGNGQILAWSEGYVRKRKCRASLMKIITAAAMGSVEIDKSCDLAR
jgi:uncharacterized protein YegP (UPF0339 family)